MASSPTSAPPASVPPEVSLETGFVLEGRYELLEPIGAGGMAEVWAARHAGMDAQVAIKFLLPPPSDRAGEALERFRREAHAMSALSHRHIARVYDLLEVAHGGRLSLALVMELLHGESLERRLQRAGKLSRDEAVSITLALLSALKYAHAAGVVHRDLKPDNVFLAREPDGEIVPKILDFGISKVVRDDVKPLTVVGDLLGTPSYMSPEQTRGAERVDARSDLFNVGILLYEMLTGTPLFDGEGLSTVVAAILEYHPTRPLDVPQPLWRVIDKALAKSVTHRFQTAAEFAQALREAVTTEWRESETIQVPSEDIPLPRATLPSARPVAFDARPSSLPPASPAEAVKRRALKIALGAGVALAVAALASVAIERRVAVGARAAASEADRVRAAVPVAAAPLATSARAAEPPRPAQAIVEPAPPASAEPASAEGVGPNALEGTNGTEAESVATGAAAARGAAAPPTTPTTPTRGGNGRVSPKQVTSPTGVIHDPGF
jgi:serine/threonine-protein kinase